MSKAKPSATSQTTLPPAQSKDARRRAQANVQMVQNVLLIWLDSNIDENSNDCQGTIKNLRRSVNTVKIFTDGDKCTQFLQDTVHEKACMIISGALGQRVLPRVHDLSQIDSIFIYCGNKTYHEEWAKTWPKIKGIYTEIQPICDALKEAAHQCEQNAISISIMGTSDTLPNKSLDQLDPSFMYTKIMKEILLTIQFEQQHIDEFIEHCRQALDGNPSQLEYVDQLAATYHKKTPIWWYTLECFLYPMLNHALRTMDADLMVKLGFFISDLHRQIQELHLEEFGSDHSQQTFTAYRGQGMEKDEFEKLIASKGGLLSFNCFLSTSKTRQISLDFAKRALFNPELVGVLFAMTIDPSLPDTSFASVANVGAFGAQEDEVLFSMNTVFRIGQIKQLDGNPRLFRVELSITSDKDNDLRQLVDRIRDETFPNDDGWRRLGLVLWKMGASAKAQQVFEVLLKETIEESERAAIYNQLGVMVNGLGKYEEAIAYYEKSITIEEKQNPCNHQSLANSYNNVSNVYSSMGDYSKALASHTKALTIRQQSLSLNHPDLAYSYNNIGSVYSSMGDYPKALLSHEKALAIQQKSLPPIHPELAHSYNNIGLVYSSMGDYSKALSSYEKALAIQQQSLPSTHPSLAASYNNIGNVYDSMQDYPKALSYYEKALAIQQQSLPPTHPDLAAFYNNMGVVHENMNNYSKAHSCYQCAVDIAECSLPPDHPGLQGYRNNLADIRDKL